MIISTFTQNRKLLVSTLSVLALIPLQGTAATLAETWESQNTANPFAGIGDRTWLGDVADFQIATAIWPTGEDLLGSRSLRSNSSASAVNSTIVTDLSAIYAADLATTWSVYVSGNSAAITSGVTFSWILMADSSEASAIEAGTINGYRLRLAGSTDALRLEKASGAGWSEIHSTITGSVNINSGWNLMASRSALGLWSYGYSTGPAGTAVTLGSAATDLTSTQGSYTGMNWTSPAGDSGDFGFDNFTVSTVPEPPALASLVVGLGLVLFLSHHTRRRHSTRF